MGSIPGERLDPSERVVRVGHRADVGPDTVSGALVARVVEDCAQGVSDGLDRQLVFEELSPGAGGDDALGVGVLIGSLRKDQQGKAEGESPESRSRSAVGDYRVTARQQLPLRDVSVDDHFVGLGAETRRIVLTADGDDEGDVLIANRVDHEPEDVEVAVPHCFHRQIDDCRRVESIEPLWWGGTRVFAAGWSQLLYGGDGCDLGRLQGRRTRVDVEVAEQSSNWMWFEPSRPPVRGRGLTGRPEK